MATPQLAQRFRFLLSDELLADSTQKAWLVILLGGLFLGSILHIHPAIDHLNCATIWDALALIFTSLLAVLYYWRLLKKDDYDFLFGRSHYLLGGLVFYILMGVFAFMAGGAVWEMLWGSPEMEHLRGYLGGLLGLAFSFLLFDGLIWVRADTLQGEAMKRGEKDLEARMKRLVGMTRRTTLYANLPVVFALSGLLVWLLADVYILGNTDQNSLVKVVGGMSAAHVLSGNLVVGILLKE